MKFRRRLLLSALVPALLFLAALAVSLVGQSRTQADFRQLTAREQTLALGYAELYADGLQMGQALRNIILDPRNPTAFKNLKSAREAYDAAYAQLSTVAAGTPFEAPTRELAALRAGQATAQDEVLQVATTDQAAAIASLNAKETPAWRALRGRLMTMGEQARHDAARRLDEVRRDAARIESLSLVLAALAACVAGAFLWDAQRTVRRELGGDPRDAGLALRRIARGDLATDVPVAPLRSLMAELSDMQQALRRLVGRVRESSESILMASTEVATGSTDLSARTEQAASNLQETAASMEQVTSSVKHSADAARTADQLATGAADTATRGAAVVDDVVRTMERISTGSRRIGDIIGVIDGIAFQTNILALNAAVEAARAGEQGRGFAVVAGEVRTLARRSAEAAREIKSLITASVEQVEAGTQLVATAGSSMSDILAAVRRVTDVVGEITAASQEQSAGVQQIGVAVARLDDMTQQNAALVEESAASAESLKEQAGGLATLVREFQLPRA